MANPTKDELLKKCGTEDCINKWREEMYLDCNKRCPEVDTEAKDSPKDFPKWQAIAETPEPTEFIAACEHGRACPAKGMCFGKVKYGKGSTWTEWRESSGEVHCANSVFGDPLHGTVKECVCLGSKTLEVEQCETEGDFVGRDNKCIDTIKAMIEAMGSHKRRKGRWADEDLTGEGEDSVVTKHRLVGGEEGIRCTDHLDLDWQMPPCCSPCEERDSAPCEDGGKGDESKYMWEFYGQFGFLNPAAIDDFTRDKCYESAGEHTWEYAYNLCTCVDCPKKDPAPCPNCIARKGCGGSYGAYDYKAHYAARDNDCAVRDDGDRSGVGYAAAKKALAGEKGVLKELSADMEGADEQ